MKNLKRLPKAEYLQENSEITSGSSTYFTVLIVTILMSDVHGSVRRKRIFKYNQQDAMLRNLFISVKCSTCFGRFLRPSSGVQNCIYSIGYFVKPLLLSATVVEDMEPVPSLPGSR